VVLRPHIHIVSIHRAARRQGDMAAAESPRRQAMAMRERLRAARTPYIPSRERKASDWPGIFGADEKKEH
jgi:hypothetical protein